MPLIDTIKSIYLGLKPQRRISFTLEGLRVYNKLGGNTRDLLVDIMYHIKTSRGYDGLVIKISHSMHPRYSRRTFYRCMSELIEYGYLYKDKTNYFVDPRMIYYFTPNLLRILGDKFNPKVVDTSKHFGL